MSQSAPYRRSGFFNNRVMNPLMTMLGLVPSLTIRGRTSGRSYTTPVWPLDYEGRRYLVAPRATPTGRATSALSARATYESGGAGFISKRPRFPCRSVLRWSPRMSGSMAIVAKEFARMPDPADHPVFVLVASQPVN